MFWRRKDEPASEPEVVEDAGPPASEPPASERATEPAATDPAAWSASQLAPARAQPAARLEHSGDLDTGLARTRGSLMTRLRGALGGPIDDATWDDVEETLIAGDVGASLAMRVVERARARRDTGGAEAAVQAELAALLVTRDGDWSPQPSVAGGPAVILVVGVNGTGKTTTIGKLAWHLKNTLGQTVVIGAADTFRAAAVEQLERWGERAGVDVVKGPEGSDPGAVAFDAVARGRERGADVVIVDTAGRLHTQHNLMDELTKVRRVITKQMPDAPHETLMTVDATTGQNGVRQAKLFGEAVGVTGIVLTKLDGTAKGGIALAIANELGIPVKLIGIGEQLDDLRPFDADEFSRALLT
jgi:fused signal recognition particle receptor